MSIAPTAKEILVARLAAMQAERDAARAELVSQDAYLSALADAEQDLATMRDERDRAIRQRDHARAIVDFLSGPPTTNAWICPTPAPEDDDGWGRRRETS